MHRTRTAIDGFRLAYRRRIMTATSPGRAVVLLHGWPGDHTDFRDVVALVDSTTDVVVVDLRGFGQSDRQPGAADELYSASAQARSVAGLIEELELKRPVLGGYDIGSRIAQQLARERPDLVGGLVISPPLPGAGARVLEPAVERELWYQGFHRSGLAATLLDGDPTGVRTYLKHFWNHWSGPGFRLRTEDLDHLLSVYSRPGAFAASIEWYRAGPGYVAAALGEQAPPRKDRLAVATEVLWQEHDPLFPRAWTDGIEAFFSDARLRLLDGVGHFTPVEAPEIFARSLDYAVRRQADRF